MAIHRALVATAALLLAVAGCNALEGLIGFDDATVRALEEVVTAEAEASTGGVVARVDAAVGEHTMAAGRAGLEGAGDLTGDEAFYLGSVTKLFTATVALQLAEQGAIDLDAPVAQVVPERTEPFTHGDEVTMRQLLGHTAGLPDYFNPGQVNEAFIQQVLARAALERGVASLSCADAERIDPFEFVEDGSEFQPGTDWAYSNVGFHLAGEVIEAVTGRPLAAVYREQILDPLGMSGTWVDCPEEPRAQLARGLHPAGAYGVTLPGQSGPVDVTELNREHWGAAGGLTSTASDLTVFARALFHGELFDDEATLEAMLEPGLNPSYGLGVQLDEDAPGHGGSVAGYHAALRYAPEHDIVLVALVNETPDPPQIRAAEVLAGLRQALADHQGWLAAASLSRMKDFTGPATRPSDDEGAAAMWRSPRQAGVVRRRARLAAR